MLSIIIHVDGHNKVIPSSLDEWAVVMMMLLLLLLLLMMMMHVLVGGRAR